MIFGYPVLVAENAEDDEDLDDLIMLEAEGRISEATDKGYLKAAGEMPAGLRACWATLVLEYQVENGGFGQYFWNIKDEALYEEARSGLKCIGAKKMLQLFEEALTIRGNYLPQTKNLTKWDDYVAFMGYNALEENHDEFSSKTFEALEKLQGIRAAFIRKNPQLFVEVEKD